MRLRTIFAAIACALLTLVAGCDKKEGDTNGAALLSSMHDGYDNARRLQCDGKYVEAIAAFKHCLALDTLAVNEDTMLTFVSDIMVQLVNTYQSLGRPADAVQCFDSIRHNSSPFVKQKALRDLYIVSAYATSRTDSMGDAERLADSALAIASYHPTPKRLFRDYAYAAAIFFPNPEREAQVISLSRKAIDEARKSGNVSGSQYVTSMLGTLYKRSGKLSDAIKLYLDSRNEARQRGDSIGEATACNALTELYLYWKIPKYADIYATKAVALCECATNSNPMTTIQSLLLKAQVMERMEHCDSSLLFFRKAERLCHNLPYTGGQADVDYLAGFHLVNHTTGDSLHMGIERLKTVASKGTPLLRAKAYNQLSTAYITIHHDDEAAVMLDSTYTLLHGFTPTQHIDVDYRRILGFYVQRGDLHRAQLFAADLLEDYCADANMEIRTQMYENIVTLQTEAEKQQVKAQRLALENERLYYRLWVLVAVATALLFAVWIVYKRKLQRTRQQLMEAKLSSLMDELEKAHKDREQAERKLSDITAQQAVVSADSKSAPEQTAAKMTLELSPSHFSQADGEMSFRQRFETLYPQFLTNIRERIPGISRREELMCMLIFLGQDPHRTAFLLGINYRSAIVSRYRIRQKMDLPKEASLEETIKALG